MEAWDREVEAHYWNPAIMDGAIPICHKGCALRQWLVIHGEQRGFVWDDLRVDNAGIAPVLGESGEPGDVRRLVHGLARCLAGKGW